MKKKKSMIAVTAALLVSILSGSSVIAAEPGNASGEETEAVYIQDPIEAPAYDIVDSHLHYLDFIQTSDGFPALTEAMDKAGVTNSVIFGMAMAKQWDDTTDEAPTYYLSNDSRCYYYPATDYILAEDLLAQPKEVQDRFYPFICGINGNDRYSADHIRKLLEIYPDFWCGIGELMSRHDDLTALTYGEPAHLNSKAFMRIYDLGAEYNLPVLVHHNITSSNSDDTKYLGELEEALAHNRDCNIIWAHVGISRRVEITNLLDVADKLLKENSNLYIDISWNVYDYYYLDNFPNQFDDKYTREDWVDLLERWPDRFMIGSDKVGHWETYPDEITKYNDLLGRLTPATRQKVCSDNILKLIKTYD